MKVSLRCIPYPWNIETQEICLIVKRNFLSNRAREIFPLPIVFTFTSFKCVYVYIYIVITG